MEISSDILGRFAERSVRENLLELGDLYTGGVVFSTSFGLEDQAITHLIAESAVAVNIFTLDTGRLFPETYSTWSATLERYKIRIEAFYPNDQALQQWISEHGPNAFYRSVENRKACCHIRKVEPLQRALKGNKVWITGIRSAQSPERQGTPILEWDAANEILKYHPLLNWSDEQLNDFIRQHNVPYNPLHDRGFVSIGCAPCTRAIKPVYRFPAQQRIHRHREQG